MAKNKMKNMLFSDETTRKMDELKEYLGLSSRTETVRYVLNEAHRKKIIEKR